MPARWLQSLFGSQARKQSSPRSSTSRPRRLLELEPLEQRVVPSTWLPTAPGTYEWDNPANWSGGSPNGDFDSANLNVDIYGDQTILLKRDIRIGYLQVGDSQGGSRFNILDSGGSLTFGHLTKSSGGDVYIGAPTFLSGFASVDISQGSLTFGDSVESQSVWNVRERQYIRNGSLTKQGGGTLILSGTEDNYDLRLVAAGGTVVLDKSGPTSAHAVGGQGLTVKSGARVQLRGTHGDQIYNGAPVTVESGGVLDLNGKTEQIDTLKVVGAVVNDNPYSDSTLTGRIANNPGDNFSLGGVGNLTINGPVESTDGFFATKVGPGMLTLAGPGDNAYLSLNAQQGAVWLAKDSGPSVHAVGPSLTIQNGATVLLIGSNGGDQIFNSAAVTVESGGTLDLAHNAETVNALFGAGTVVLSGALTVDNSAPATFSGVLSGTGPLIKTGSGTLTLAGNGDNVSLRAVVNGGTLELAKANSGAAPHVHAIGGGGLTINSGGTVRLAGSGGDQIYDGAPVTVNDGGTFDLNGKTEKVGSMTIKGAGVGGNGALVNNLVNSTGTLTNNIAGIPSGSTTNSFTLGGSGALTLSGAVAAGSPFSVFKAGAGLLTLSGPADNSYLELVVDGGSVVLDKQGGSARSANVLTLNSGTVQIGPNTGGTQVFGRLTVNGGTFDLNGKTETHFHTILGGGSIINGRLVNIGSDYDLRRGTVSANLGGTFGVSKSVSDDSDLLTLSGANTYTGGTTVGRGTLALGSAGALGTTGIIRFTGGTLQYSGTNTTDYSNRFSVLTGQQYRFDTNGQTVTFASALTSSSGSLTKLGLGTLTLTGASSYTGATTINGGTLLVNGSLASNGAVAVSAGAALGGAGSVGNVTVNGTLSPGASFGSTGTGILNTRSVTFLSDSAFQVDLNGTGSGAFDRLNVTGAVNLSGSLQVSAALPLAIGDSFTSSTTTERTRSPARSTVSPKAILSRTPRASGSGSPIEAATATTWSSRGSEAGHGVRQGLRRQHRRRATRTFRQLSRRSAWSA